MYTGALSYIRVLPQLIYYNYLIISELLIIAGECRMVNGKDNTWVTPLHIACRRNNAVSKFQFT